MVSHFTLTLDGNVQRLSSVLPQGTTADAVTVDRTYSFMALQADSANAAVVYVGGFPTVVSSTNFGVVIPIPATSVPAAPFTVTAGSGPAIRLSEWTVKGTNTEKLHILLKD